jgi:acyl-CoA thioester hydrolase
MRIYIEDTDAGGIVYHPNYLNFFARARSEWLRELGFDLQSLQERKVIFPICEIEIAYRRPLRLDDSIEIHTELLGSKKCSMIFLQKIYRKQDLQSLICEAKIKVACVDENLQPQCIPQEILSKIL